MRVPSQDLELLCDALVRFLSPFGEVVLHDITTQSIRYISGNLSNRQIGDPSFLEELDLSTQSDPIVGPYRKTGADGRVIKSISVLLRNDRQSPGLLLCINMDVSRFDAAREALSALVGNSAAGHENPFVDDWLEKLNGFIAQWSLEHGMTIKGMSPENRKRLLVALKARGVFERPKAAVAVAAALQVSRATIYQDLRTVSPAEGKDHVPAAVPADNPPVDHFLGLRHLTLENGE